ncbi:hypothetical protein NG794_05555 [Laspinema sp. D6]|nr:hypothetical protein [Laspinema sp. D3a]
MQKFGKKLSLSSLGCTPGLGKPQTAIPSTPIPQPAQSACTLKEGQH